LRLAKLLPVDVRLHRVDALLHQPANELFEPPIHFALHENVGGVLHPAGELLKQLVPNLMIGLVLGLVLQVLFDPLPELLERPELADFLRKLIVDRQQFLAPDALDRDVVNVAPANSGSSYPPDT
jgi:hypothetical protein